MQAGIKITMIWADLYDVDELCEFILQVSNGSCAASQQFYLDRGGFKDFAKELRNFPSNIESRIKFECGGQERSWATYLLFEVFCYELNFILEDRSVELILKETLSLGTEIHVLFKNWLP